MNHLLGIGVAGFRIDASKHIWPQDIDAIIGKLNNLNTQWFPQGSRPFIYQEVTALLFTVCLLFSGLGKILAFSSSQ